MPLEIAANNHRFPITVVMPVRNEAAFIEQSLGSVIAQDYPAALLEIIVVDGMSDDGTREIIRDLIDRQQLSAGTGPRSHADAPSLMMLDNPSHTVPFALNIALEHARGMVIVRVDGHCEIPKDYVSRCVDELIQSRADCAGGVIKTVGLTPVANYIAVAQSSMFGVGGAAFRTGRTKPGLTDTLAFGAYRRDVFDRLGAFDVEMVRNQDDEFNYRLLHSGGKIWMNPSIEAIYYSRASVSGLWKQYLQYGCWKVRVLQKHPGQMRVRQFAPAALVALVLVLAILALFARGVLFLAFGLMTLYLAVLVIATLSAVRKVGTRSFATIAFAFIALHWGYGLGFLFGLVKFWNRWGERIKNPVCVDSTGQGTEP